MTQPLALVLYERLLPGTQLVNKLQDLNYRVHVVTGAEELAACAEKEKAMVVLADLVSSHNDVCSAIASLKRNAATKHIPVIGFADEEADALRAAAKEAGVNLIVNDAAILTHLPQFLEQALQVE